MKIHKIIKKFMIAVVILGMLSAAVVFGTDIYVKQSTKGVIINTEQVADLKNMECILVLGAEVKADGTPSLMLRDRLDKTIQLYRAVYDAKAFGIELYGVAAKKVRYGGQSYRDFREILARDKDFVITKLKIKPICLGDAISLNQIGDITNDGE